MNTYSDVEMFKFVQGRLNTGYFKLKLFEIGRLDAFILKYPSGSYVGWHRDKAPDGFAHYRMNLILIPAIGGHFFIQGKAIIKSKFFNFFRADLYAHSVTTIKKGTRYVLSIGWLWKNK